VVGAANSGAQIAMELGNSRQVYLAGRSVGSLPRRILGRDLFDWLYATVMRPGADSTIGRRIRSRVLGSTDALIGFSERDIVRAGVVRTGRVEGARDGMPLLASGEPLDVRSVVWATGFRPDFRWIDLPILDERGFPVHERGVVAGQPGLFFVGLRFQHRLNSSLIGGVGADAEHVARAVMARYGMTRSNASNLLPGRVASM
jgi:putative flavoprotein involved in K+ transport